MQGLTIYNASLMSYQLIHALHAAFEPILRGHQHDHGTHGIVLVVVWMSEHHTSLL